MRAIQNAVAGTSGGIKQLPIFRYKHAILIPVLYFLNILLEVLFKRH